ncbi:MAG: TRAP transporter substrate-binding protein DctP, partial [Clostridia bacterium]|nr:TRAP transporter substrate-binding protein DctP [Clostridia bacterium]
GPNDIYSAITQGTIDGAENNWPTYYTKGDYEAATYFCLDGHTRVPEILLASAEVMSELDEADVEIIKACAKETQEYEKKLWAEMEAEAEAAVRANGNTITVPTAEAIAEFQAAMTTPSDVLGGVSLYEKYGKGLEEYIDAIKAVGENF